MDQLFALLQDIPSQLNVLVTKILHEIEHSENRKEKQNTKCLSTKCLLPTPSAVRLKNHNLDVQSPNRNLTSRNSLPARAIAPWKASFSFSEDWSGSIQSKLNFPTLEDKCVLFTYFGGWSVSYWLIPLSIASIACSEKFICHNRKGLVI